MTSLKQIEANRRNAQKSTGPTTLDGKQRSRCNALRHGLTAETVIGVLESSEDYAAFEAAIMAEYDAQSIIECELVARLASLLWRLRRATAIETGLFEMQADPLAGFKQFVKSSASSASLTSLKKEVGSADRSLGSVAGSATSSSGHLNFHSARLIRGETSNLAQCFMRLTNAPNFVLDRLSRYEGRLWRQVVQIMYALNNLVRTRK